MLPFAKPGASESYPMLGAHAAKAALDDARVDYQSVNQVYAGYLYGGPAAGRRPSISRAHQRAGDQRQHGTRDQLHRAVPGRQAVASGAAEVRAGTGFEQMARGALGVHFQDRPDPSQRLLDTMQRIQGMDAEAPSRRSFSAAPGACTCSSTAPAPTPSPAS